PARKEPTAKAMKPHTTAFNTKTQETHFLGDSGKGRAQKKLNRKLNISLSLNNTLIVVSLSTL
ncbi:MAG: hypothetical protein RSB74_07505, partial [Kiritimatiellia bacterium]